MTAAEIVGRLAGARRVGAGWLARCPAHEDQRASLSIGQGERGVVLRCHAGCDITAITKAAGLKVSDLESKLTADALLAEPASDEDKDALRGAIEFLRAALQAGPVDAREVQRDASTAPRGPAQRGSGQR